MTRGESTISTNAATAIRLLLGPEGGLTERYAFGGSPSALQTWNRWSQIFDVPIESPTAPSRVLTQTLGTLVLSLAHRSRMQLPVLPVQVEAVLDRAEDFLAAAVAPASVFVPGSPHLEQLKKFLDPHYGLAIIEGFIGKDWHPIPASSLTELATTVENSREALVAAMALGEIEQLLGGLLDEALDWALRGITVSQKFGVLIGIGESLRRVTTVGQEVAAITEVRFRAQGRTHQDDGPLKQLHDWLIVAEAAAVVFVLAGLLPITATAIPTISLAAPAIVSLSGRREQFEQAIEKWVKLLESVPAVEAGALRSTPSSTLRRRQVNGWRRKRTTTEPRRVPHRVPTCLEAVGRRVPDVF